MLACRPLTNANTAQTRNGVVLEDMTRLRHAMRQAGLQEIRFHFEFEGMKIVAQ
jgi:hypothetical protein